ncbi:hypothetical protein Bca101_010536 [Brassica carinata]
MFQISISLTVAGVAPNVVTYDAVIDGVVISGKYDEALMFKEKMVEDDQSPCLATRSVPEERVRELARTAGSSTDWTDQNVDPENRVAAGKGVAKDGNVPTVVLTYSSAKASKNASSSSSTSGDPEKEDGAPAARSGEVLVPNNDPPASPFGRVSGAKIFLLIMNEAFCLL